MPDLIDFYAVTRQSAPGVWVAEIRFKDGKGNVNSTRSKATFFSESSAEEYALAWMPQFIDLVTKANPEVFEQDMNKVDYYRDGVKVGRA